MLLLNGDAFSSSEVSFITSPPLFRVLVLVSILLLSCRGVGWRRLSRHRSLRYIYTMTFEKSFLSFTSNNTKASDSQRSPQTCQWFIFEEMLRLPGSMLAGWGGFDDVEWRTQKALGKKINKNNKIHNFCKSYKRRAQIVILTQPKGTTKELPHESNSRYKFKQKLRLEHL